MSSHSKHTFQPITNCAQSIGLLILVSQARAGHFCSMLVWPSIDPELMIGMLIIGYCFGIRSKRDSGKRSTSI